MEESGVQGNATSRSNLQLKIPSSFKSSLIKHAATERVSIINNPKDNIITVQKTYSSGRSDTSKDKEKSPSRLSSRSFVRKKISDIK